MRIPPDPEGQNDDRARWAEAAVAEFQAQTRTEDGDAISDLLADLMHLCDREPRKYGGTFARHVKRALMHYDEETGSKGKQGAEIVAEGWRG